MQSVTTDCFGDKDICLWKRLWIGENLVDWSAYISCIGNSFNLTLFGYFYIGNTTAKHMTCICELNFYVFINPEFHLIRHSDKETHTGCSIFLCIKGSHLGQSFLCSAFIECNRIMLLYKSRISKTVSYTHLTLPTNREV